MHRAACTVLRASVRALCNVRGSVQSASCTVLCWSHQARGTDTRTQHSARCTDTLLFSQSPDRGIPAVLALLWLIVKAVVDFGRAVRRLPADNTLQRAVLHGCIAGIIAILVEGVFETNLGDSEVLTMFLGVVGAGYVTAREVGHG